ncbi:hypothetical protein KKH38_01985 [Patescibacteria group bacterium]|nr:hypothetical protein [Patescibacteria group bacterium]MBU4600672.1 hypothetical protein [Patescibacteria group bacterium]MCG2698590.1 hypothetical protein [Candidatus Parcubacteria bacterium]
MSDKKDDNSSMSLFQDEDEQKDIAGDDDLELEQKLPMQNQDSGDSDDDGDIEDLDEEQKKISEHGFGIEEEEEQPLEESNNNSDEQDMQLEKSSDDEDEPDMEPEKSTKQDETREESPEQPKEESVSITKSKIVLAKKLLSNIKENNDRLLQIFSGMVDSKDEDLISIGQMADEAFESGADSAGSGKIIEGVFDGENMIGPDGKQYSVPANYASKSKMVEGDILKLTITGKGTFIYKQISPIDRSRIVGELERNSDGSYAIIANSRKWRVLTASVTYFKGEPGDEAVILIPKTGESKWAAVENIVKNKMNYE